MPSSQTNFQPLFKWMKERDATLNKLGDAIKFIEESALLKTDMDAYATFETMWNEACMMLNAESPKFLIQLIVRYEATLAAIAAIPMQSQIMKMRPRIAPLLIAGRPEAELLDQQMAVCPICGAATPLPIFNGSRPEHGAGCPVWLAQDALTLPS